MSDLAFSLSVCGAVDDVWQYTLLVNSQETGFLDSHGCILYMTPSTQLMILYIGNVNKKIHG